MQGLFQETMTFLDPYEKTTRISLGFLGRVPRAWTSYVSALLRLPKFSKSTCLDSTMSTGLPDDRKGKLRELVPLMFQSHNLTTLHFRSKKDVVRRGRKTTKKVFRVGWRSGVCWCFCREKTGCKDES